MIKVDKIRELTRDITFSKGEKIYLERDRIRQFEIEQPDWEPEIDCIDGFVRGSSRNLYYVYIEYNREKEEVETADCECPAFSSYSGLCKHCVAMLLQYRSEQIGSTLRSERLLREREEEIWSERQKNSRPPAGRAVYKKQTNQSIIDLMQARTREKTAHLLQKEVYGKVRLEPSILIFKVGINTRITCEFKIGADRMYVLKDVFEFAWNLKRRNDFAYGKNLQFVHTPESFAEDSRELAGFILSWAEKHDAECFRRDWYYPQTQKVRQIDLDTEELEALLDAAGSRSVHMSVMNYPQKEWVMCRRPPEVGFLIRKAEEGIEVSHNASALLCGGKSLMYFHNGEIFRLGKKGLLPVWELLSCMDNPINNPFYVAEEDIPAFCRMFLPALKSSFPVRMEDFDESLYSIDDVKFAFYLDAPESDVIVTRAEAIYGDKKYNLFLNHGDEGSRDQLRELEVRELVSGWLGQVDSMTGDLIIGGDEDAVCDLLTEGIDVLSEIGEVYVSEKLKGISIRPAPKVSVGVSLSGDLLELTMSAGDISRDELAEILGRYRTKKKYYRLKNGDFLQIDDESIATLAELQEGLGLTGRQLREEQILLPKYRALYLDSQLREKAAVPAERSRDFRALIRDMKTVEDNDFSVPVSLSKVLRSYQEQGFLWLKTLSHNGFGGILADDMGLGKTLQVITYLLSEQEEKGQETGPALIVCPASLVYNWESEIHRFAPQLHTHLITGSAAVRKDLIRDIRPGDICVTSYDLLKRDVKAYQDTLFSCQVIDEAQYIKNHSTQAAKAVKQIRAEFKVALTGTPVENRLSELWSIFDYLMPGFLYSYERFRKELETPVVQNGDQAAAERLRKMCGPFILRRLKQDVLHDLPDKIEKNMVTRLEGEQRRLYDAHVKQLQLFLDGSSDEDFAVSKIQILSQLTRLRQLCCDPALMYEDYRGGSGKLQMCMELIENAVSGGHKILLFSQFTSMLDRVAVSLQSAGISCYMLTGATAREKRQQLVQAFNTDDTSVFLISLKAGGTGLNLTAADMVIHFDPWWNLAVQNQATDRAHRIGQKKVVTVYRLIAQDTIEEKIVQLQERKKDLADQILGAGDMSSTSFSREELLELLG
ncbi:MAG: SNF2 helicase associated domain-containing protein [Emergencia sp.]